MNLFLNKIVTQRFGYIAIQICIVDYPSYFCEIFAVSTATLGTHHAKVLTAERLFLQDHKQTNSGIETLMA